MTWHLRAALTVLLAIAVGLVLLGQFQFLQKQPSFGEAVLFFVVGAAVFAFVAWLVEAQSSDTAVGVSDEELSLSVPRAGSASEPAVERGLSTWFREHTLVGLIQAITGVVSVILAALTLQMIASRPANYAWPFVTWLISVLLFVVIWVRRARHPSNVLTSLAPRRWEMSALALIILMGLGLRVVALDTVPQNVSGDEGSTGLEAMRFLEGQTNNMFDLGWASSSTMVYFGLAQWFRLFGVSVFTLRLVSALVGTATLVVFYFLLRQFFGVRVALVSTALLTTFHFHVHFSRVGFFNVAEPFAALLALWLLNRAGERRSPLSYALCGLVAGLAMYLQTGARIVPVWLGAVLIGDLLLGNPRWPRRRDELIALAGTFLIVAAPMLFIAIERLDDFNARVNQVNIFRNGWLENEQRATGHSAREILVGQFKRSLFSVNIYPDRAAQYKPGIPFLNFGGSLLCLMGLIHATYYAAAPAYWPFILLFWMTIILGGMINLEPPSSARLIQLAPLLSLFVGLGVVRLWDMARRLLFGELVDDEVQCRQIRLIGLLVPGILVIWLAVSSVHFYFFEYTPKGLYTPGVTEVATQVGYYLRELDDDYYVYFFGPPWLYFGFSTIPFLAGGKEGMDVHDTLSGPPTFVRPDHRAVFIFIPERRGELDIVRQRYPHGELREFHSPLGGELLFLAYQVERVDA